MNGIVSNAIVPGESQTQAASKGMRDAALELVFAHGLQRRPRYRKVLKKSRKAGTRNQDVLQRRWNKKVIVGSVQYSAGGRQPVRQVHARTEVEVRRGEIVTIVAQAGVHPQIARDLHRILHVSARLSPGSFFGN